MARKTSSTKVNQQIEDAIEDGLDFDFDLDIDSSDLDSSSLSPSKSAAELEAQITRAADQLSEADETEKKAKNKKPAAKQEAVPAAPARGPVTSSPPRPLAESDISNENSFEPANDTAGSSRARIMQMLETKAPSTAYWLAGAASIAWVAGSAYVADRYFNLQLANPESIVAAPNGMAMIAGATIPVALFFALAALVKRGQEMRIATRSMAEVALQLTEPEVKAQNRIMTVSQAIRREVASLDEGIGRTLDRAVDLESRVHTEVHELERSYSNNEERIRVLLDNLGREREAVVEHSERVREALLGVHQELRGELDGASNTMRDNITSATREISTNLHNIAGDLLGRITDQSGQFRTIFEESAGNFSTQMQDTGASFAKLMDERTEIAVSAFNQTADKVGNSVESQIDALKDRLAASGQDLIAEFETRTHNAEESASRLTSALDTRTKQVNDTLLARTKELAESLASAKTDIEGSINGGREAIRGQIDEFTNRASTMVDEQTSRVAASLKDNTDALAEAFGTGQMAMEMAFAQNHSRFAEEFDAMVNGATVQFDEKSTLLSEKLNSVRTATTMSLSENIDRLDKIFNTHRDAVEGRADRMENTLVSTTTALEESANKQAAILRDSLQGSTENMSQLLNAHGETVQSHANRMENTLTATTSALEESAQNQASILREALQASAQNLNQMFGAQRETIDDQTARMATNLAQAGEALEMVINRQNSTLDERGKAMHAMLNATNQTLIEAFDNQNNTVSERAASITNDIQNATSSLQAALDAQVGTMEERTTRLEGEIARAAEALNAAFESQSSTIGDRARAFEQTLETKIGELSGHTMRLQDEVGRTTGTLNAAFEAQSGIIEERTSTMQAALEKGVGNIRGTLENAAVTVADKLRAGVKDAANSLSEEAKRAETALSTTGESFSQRLDSVIDHANDKLSAQYNQINAVINDADAATERLATRTAEGTTALSNAAEGLEGRINETISAAGARLAEKGTEIATNLQSINAHIDDQIREADKTLQKAAATAAERLRNENAALVSALTARTEQSITALTTTENALGAGVTELLDRLTASNAKLGSLIDMATSNLGDVDERLASTTERFSEQTQNTVDRLSSSIHMVDSNVGRLSELSGTTLNEIAAIANRFDDHGRVLASASDLLKTAQNNLTGTLEERKEALDQLASGLVNKSAEIEHSMANFEQMVQTMMSRAEDKTRDTSEHMQRAIADAVESSTERFLQASMQLRQSAQDIREDLASTRDDLERGVLELPEETRKSTGALRRAVGDQISALQELSNIVGKSRSAMGVSLPDDRIAAAPRTSAPAQNFQSSLRAPERAAPQRPAPQPRPAPQQAAPRIPIQRMPEPAQAAPSGGNDSWVGDLLRRASTDEAPRKPMEPKRPVTQVVDSLNSLSVDIARAIDHNTSVDLWERYARGERDVFTRRLYTLRGQQTFDEIREKFVSEREFHEAVVRYCEDFEKLLGDVAKSDRTGLKTREYLTSDTGKVYTMLAHASGRLH